MPALLSSIKNRILHLQQSSYGLILAAIITFSFFYYVPGLWKLGLPYLQNIPNPYFLIILAVIGHTGSFVILHTSMYIIYKLNLPVFEREKISNKPWPWESDPETWNKLCKKTLKHLAFYHFVIVPILSVIDARLSKAPMSSDLDNFPEITEIIAQIAFFMVWQDFSFYWTHRFLHKPRIYPYIHKMHHEYNITISISSEHAHPIEFILGNIVPVNIGPKILMELFGVRVHVVTFYMWLFVVLAESCDAHCGYEFSWSPFRLLTFSGASVYHSFHHSHNAGNYGSFFTFWDRICATNKYDEYMENRKKKAETEKEASQSSVYKKIHEKQDSQKIK